MILSSHDNEAEKQDNGDGPVRLTKEHAKPAAEVMARAFFDDTLSRYFYPDETERREKQTNDFLNSVRYGLLYGEVYATSRKLEGVALWLRSERVHRTPWRTLRSEGLPALLRSRKKETSAQGDYREYTTAIYRRCATMPHMHLQILAVDPVYQGKGYGVMLLDAMFKRLDKEGKPCFLLTQNETNVTFYEHRGFKVVERSEFPRNNVITWYMLRERAGG